MTLFAIKADSLQIAAAAAFIMKWQIPVTEVLSERGESQGGALLLIGGPIRVKAGEAPLRDGLDALQLAVV